MNKVYKVIYSKTKNAYVVVSELTKTTTKSASTKTAKKVTGLSLAILTAVSIASPNPSSAYRYDEYGGIYDAMENIYYVLFGPNKSDWPDYDTSPNRLNHIISETEYRTSQYNSKYPQGLLNYLLNMNGNPINNYGGMVGAFKNNAPQGTIRTILINSVDSSDSSNYSTYGYAFDSNANYTINDTMKQSGSQVRTGGSTPTYTFQAGNNSVLIGNKAFGTGNESVIIGNQARTIPDFNPNGQYISGSGEVGQSTIIGADAVGVNDPFGFNMAKYGNNGSVKLARNQSTAIGNDVVAAGQATAIGSNVYAVGNSSIAIGNDDNVGYYSVPITGYDYSKYLSLTYDKLNSKGGSRSSTNNPRYSVVVPNYKGQSTTTTLYDNGKRYIREITDSNNGYYKIKDEQNRVIEEFVAGGDGAFDGKLISKTYSGTSNSPSATVEINAIRYDSHQQSGKSDKAQYSPTISQGYGSIAMGSRALANDTGSTAVGTLAFALKEGSTAIGAQSRAEGIGSIALGNKARVFSDNAIGTGNEVQVKESGAAAYGYRAFATGKNSLALGTNVFANTDLNKNVIVKQSNSTLNSTNFFSQDNGTTVTNEGAYLKNIVAIARGYINGEKTNTIAGKLGTDTVSIVQKEFLNSSTREATSFYEDLLSNKNNSTGGILSPITENFHGINDIAKGIGVDQNKPVNNAIVIGSDSWAGGFNTVALGRGTFSLGENSMALGSYSVANQTNSLSIGTMSHSLGKNSISLGTGANTTHQSDDSIAIGSAAVTEGKSSLSIGKLSWTRGDSNIAIGNNAVIRDMNKVMGTNNTLVASNNNEATSKFNTIIGEKGYIGSGVQYSTALGYNASIGDREEDKTSGDYDYSPIKNALALGANTNIYESDDDEVRQIVDIASTDTQALNKYKEFYKGNNAVAIGYGASATLNNSMALGTNSKTDYSAKDLSHAPWVVPGAISIPTSAQTGVISVGAKNRERRIVNLASGFRDTDAVNVAQLKMAVEKVAADITGELSDGEHYESVNSWNKEGEAYKLSQKVNLQTDYQTYADYLQRLTSYMARKNINGENINDEVLNQLKDRLDKMNEKSKAAIQAAGSAAGSNREYKTIATKLWNEYNKISAMSVDNSLSDEAKSQKLDEKMKEIEDLYNQVKNANVLQTPYSVDELKYWRFYANYDNNLAQGADSLAFGYSAQVAPKATGGIAQGRYAQVLDAGNGKNGQQGIAIGNAALNVGSRNSVAIGSSTQTRTSEDSFVFGVGSKVDNSDQSILLGKGSTIERTKGSILLGAESSMGTDRTENKSQTFTMPANTVRIGSGYYDEAKINELKATTDTNRKIVEIPVDFTNGSKNGVKLYYMSTDIITVGGKQVPKEGASPLTTEKLNELGVPQVTFVKENATGNQRVYTGSLNNNEYNIAIGNKLTVRNANYGTVLGYDSGIYSADNAVVMGRGSNVKNGERSLAIGTFAKVEGEVPKTETQKQALTTEINNINTQITQIQNDINAQKAIESNTNKTPQERETARIQIEAKQIELQKKQAEKTRKEAERDGHTASNSVAIGDDAKVIKSKQSITIGKAAKVDTNSQNSIALGPNVTIWEKVQDSVAIGSGAWIGGSTSNAIALGKNAQVNNESHSSIAIGDGAKIESRNTLNSIALGKDAIINGNNTNNGIAIGYDAKISGNSNNAIAIGTGAEVQTGAANSIALGSRSWAWQDANSNNIATSFGGTYSLNNEGVAKTNNGLDYTALLSIGNGNTGKIFTRRIVNLAAGVRDTDAVNVAQLKSLASNEISFTAQYTPKDAKAATVTNTSKVALGTTSNEEAKLGGTATANQTNLQFTFQGEGGIKVNAANKVITFSPEDTTIITDEGDKTLSLLGKTISFKAKGKDEDADQENYDGENIATWIDVTADKNVAAVKLGLAKTPRFDALEIGAKNTQGAPTQITKLTSANGVLTLSQNTSDKVRLTGIKTPDGNNNYDAVNVEYFKNNIQSGKMKYKVNSNGQDKVTSGQSTNVPVEADFLNITQGDGTANGHTANTKIPVSDAKAGVVIADAGTGKVVIGLSDEARSKLDKVLKNENALANIQSEIDGSPMVYTTTAGDVIKKIGGKFYLAQAVGDKKFINGKFYAPDQFNADGSLKNNAIATNLAEYPATNKIIVSALGRNGNATNSATILGNVEGFTDGKSTAVFKSDQSNNTSLEIETKDGTIANKKYTINIGNKGKITGVQSGMTSASDLMTKQSTVKADKDVLETVATLQDVQTVLNTGFNLKGDEAGTNTTPVKLTKTVNINGESQQYGRTNTETAKLIKTDIKAKQGNSGDVDVQLSLDTKKLAQAIGNAITGTDTDAIAGKTALEGGLSLSYKVNDDTTPKKTSLTQGLTFKQATGNNAGISISTDATDNGVVNIGLDSTVKSAIDTISSKANTTDLENYAKLDGSNLTSTDTSKPKINPITWAAALGTGTITDPANGQAIPATNNNLVTGETVRTAINAAKKSLTSAGFKVKGNDETDGKTVALGTTLDVLGDGKLVKVKSVAATTNPAVNTKLEITLDKGELAKAVAGEKGAAGFNGTNGLDGKDGLANTSLKDRVESLRSGTAGNMVYTDSAGNRLENINGKYYNKDEADKIKAKVTDGTYKVANDGYYYESGNVDADGNPQKNATPIEIGTDVATSLAQDKVFISAVRSDGSTTEPIALRNVSTISGNGVDIKTVKTDNDNTYLEVESKYQVTTQPEDGGASTTINKKSTITIGKDGKINGIEAGTSEKDAVNYGQLSALETKVTNLGTNSYIDIAGDVEVDNAGTKTKKQTLNNAKQLTITGIEQVVKPQEGTDENAQGYKPAESKQLIKSTVEKDGADGNVKVNLEIDTANLAKAIVNGVNGADGKDALQKGLNINYKVNNATNKTPISLDTGFNFVEGNGEESGDTPNPARTSANAKAGIVIADGGEGKIVIGLDDSTRKAIDSITKGADGVNGTNGQAGTDGVGTTGPRGKDGYNNTSLGTKVDALRDGLAGNMVYTDKDGNRLENINGKYYTKTEAAKITADNRYKKANNGYYYEASKVDADGNLTDKSAVPVDFATVMTTDGATKLATPLEDNNVFISAVKADGTTTNTVALRNISSIAGSKVKAELTDAGEFKIATATGSNDKNITISKTGINMDSTKITSLAKGTGDTDAVNVSQLKAVLTALGGEAGLETDTTKLGEIKAPTYNLHTNEQGVVSAKPNDNTARGTTSHRNIGSALTSLDKAITKNFDEINSLKTNSNIIIGSDKGSPIDTTKEQTLNLTKKVTFTGQTQTIGTGTNDTGKLINTIVKADDTTSGNVTVEFGIDSKNLAKAIGTAIKGDDGADGKNALLEGLTISYRTNSVADNAAKTVSLKKGLDFVTGTGIAINSGNPAAPIQGSDKIHEGIAIATGDDGKVVIGLNQATKTAIDKVATNETTIKSLSNEINTIKEGGSNTMVYTLENGEKVTKVNNKLYKVADVTGKRFDATSGKFYANDQFKPDGTLKDNPTELLAQPTALADNSTVIISTVNQKDGSTTEPVTLGNVNAISNKQNGSKIEFMSEKDSKNTSLKITNTYETISDDGEKKENLIEIEIGKGGKITGLVDGEIKAGSKDAITGGQLHAIKSKVDQLAGGEITAAVGYKVNNKGVDKTEENVVKDVPIKADFLNFVEGNGSDATANNVRTTGAAKEGIVIANGNDGKVVIGLDAATRKAIDNITKGADGVNGTLGTDGADGAAGTPATGGAIGPKGQDGLNGTAGKNGSSLSDKVEATRDGLTGNMVYTTSDGTRVKAYNGKYYSPTEAAKIEEKIAAKEYTKANNGYYYSSSDVNEDGSLKDPATAMPVDFSTVMDGANKLATSLGENEVFISAVRSDGSTTKPVSLRNIQTVENGTTKLELKDGVLEVTTQITNTGNDSTTNPKVPNKIEIGKEGKITGVKSGMGTAESLVSTTNADTLGTVATLGDVQKLASSGFVVAADEGKMEGNPQKEVKERQLSLTKKVTFVGKEQEIKAEVPAPATGGAVTPAVNGKLITTKVLEDGTSGDVKVELGINTTNLAKAIVDGKDGADGKNALLGGLEISYRANGAEDTAAQKVSLAKGLDFVAGTGKDITAGTPAVAIPNSANAKEGIAIVTGADGKVIIGLADATRTKIDDTATKVETINNVVNNIKLAGTTPMVYTLEDGTKVTKLGNNIYKVADVENKGYDKTTDKFYALDQFKPDGTLKDKAQALATQPTALTGSLKVIISAVNQGDGSTTTATTIGNVSAIENKKDGSKIEFVTDAAGKNTSIKVINKYEITGTDGQTTPKKSEIEIGKGGKITGLVDGTIAENSTDAITGGQLFGIKTKVDQLAGGEITASVGYKVNSKGQDTTVEGETKDVPIKAEYLNFIEGNGTDASVTTARTTADAKAGIVIANGNDGKVVIGLDASTRKAIDTITKGADGVNGTNGTDGADGTAGTPATGGAVGPKGQDGLNGTAGKNGSSLSDKVEATRDGLTGNMVYTTSDGTRIKAYNGKYYNSTEAAKIEAKIAAKEYIKANNGYYYSSSDVNEDGSLKDPATAMPVDFSEVMDGANKLATSLGENEVFISAVRSDGSTTKPVSLRNIQTVENGTTKLELKDGVLEVTTQITNTGNDSTTNPKVPNTIKIGEEGKITGVQSGMTSAETLLTKNIANPDDKKVLNTVATLKDVQTVLAAGFNVAGDDATSKAKAVNVKLTKTVNIIGESQKIGTKADTTPGAATDAVVDDNQQLITTTVTQSAGNSGNVDVKLSIDTAKLAKAIVNGVNGADGKDALQKGLNINYKVNNASDKTPISLDNGFNFIEGNGTDSTTNTTRTVADAKSGIVIANGNDGKVVIGLDATTRKAIDTITKGADGVNGTDATPGTNGNDGIDATGGKAGAKGQDGLNGAAGEKGASILDKVEATRDGLTGNMVYTNADGERLKAYNGKYFTQAEAAKIETKIKAGDYVKANNGYYYAKDAVNNDGTLKDSANAQPVDFTTVQDAGTNLATALGKDEIFISAVRSDGSTTEPIALRNVSTISGNGVDIKTVKTDNDNTYLEVESKYQVTTQPEDGGASTATNKKSTITIGKDGKISGIEAGTAEKDAVNFGQLSALETKVTTLGTNSYIDIAGDVEVDNAGTKTKKQTLNNAKQLTITGIEQVVKTQEGTDENAQDYKPAESKQLIKSTVVKDGADGNVKVNLEIDTANLAKAIVNGVNGSDGKDALQKGLNINYKVNNATNKTPISLHNGFNFVEGNGEESGNTPNPARTSANAKAGIVIADGGEGKIVIGLDDSTRKAIDSITKGADGVNGTNGQAGTDGVGTTGPRGKDGYNNTSLGTKVDALRDGLAGNMVYTDKDGNRLENINGKYYTKTEAAKITADNRYKKANNGYYYEASKVDADGNLIDKAAVPVDFANVMTTDGATKLSTPLEDNNVFISAVKSDGSTTDTVALRNIASLEGSDSKVEFVKDKDTNKTSLKITTKVQGENGLKDHTIEIGKDGKITNLADAALTDISTDAVTGKQLHSVMNQLGLGGNTTTENNNGAAGKDGLNGKSIIEKVQGLRDGLAGSMVYTKEDGTRLSRVGNDFYVASDIANKKYNEADQKWYPVDQFDQNGSLKADATGGKTINPLTADDKVVISAVDPKTGATTTATVIKNVGSGLVADTTIADLVDNKSRKKVTGQADTVTALTNNELNTVATIGDLQKVAQAGFNVAGDDATSKAKAVNVKLTKTVNIIGESQKIGTKADTTPGAATDAVVDDNQQLITTTVTQSAGNSGNVDVKLSINTANLAKAILNGENGTDGKNGKDALREGLNLSYRVNSNSVKSETSLLDGLNFVQGNGTATGKTIANSTIAATEAKAGVVVTEAGNGTIVIGLDADTRAALDSITKGTDGVNGKDGQPGTDGVATTGPKGQDGLNSKSINEQLSAIRSGLAGSMVYTDGDGNRLENINGKFYTKEEGAKIKADDRYKLANNGYYYEKGKVDQNGNQVDKNAIPVDFAEVTANGTTDKLATPMDDNKVLISAVKADGSTTEPVSLRNIGSISNGTTKLELKDGALEVTTQITNTGDDKDTKPKVPNTIKIGENGKITGLSSGSVAEGSTDAITGGQLHALQKDIEAGNISSKMRYRINNEVEANGNSAVTKADHLNFIAGAGTVNKAIPKDASEAETKAINDTNAEETKVGIELAHDKKGNITIGLTEAVRTQLDKVEAGLKVQGNAGEVINKQLDEVLDIKGIKDEDKQSYIDNLNKILKPQTPFTADNFLTNFTSDNLITYNHQGKLHIGLSKNPVFDTLRTDTIYTDKILTKDGKEFNTGGFYVKSGDTSYYVPVGGVIEFKNGHNIEVKVNPETNNLNPTSSTTTATEATQTTAPATVPDTSTPAATTTAPAAKEGTIPADVAPTKPKDSAIVISTTDQLTTADITPDVGNKPNDGKLVTNVNYVNNYVDNKIEKVDEQIKDLGTKIEELVTDTTTVINGINNKIDSVSKTSSSGIAAAMASAQIPQVLNTNKRNVMGIGFGNYDGQSAIAIGVSGTNRNRDISYRASATYDSVKNIGFSAGVGFSFGPDVVKSDSTYRTNDFSERLNKQAEEIEKLNIQNQELKEAHEAQIKELKDQNAEIKKENEELRDQIKELAALVHKRLAS